MDMNGTYIKAIIEEQTEGFIYARKLAFIDEVLEEIQSYRTDFMIAGKPKERLDGAVRRYKGKI